MFVCVRCAWVEKRINTVYTLLHYTYRCDFVFVIFCSRGIFLNSIPQTINKTDGWASEKHFQCKYNHFASIRITINRPTSSILCMHWILLLLLLLYRFDTFLILCILFEWALRMRPRKGINCQHVKWNSKI